ncbi:MAG: beta-ketoacyl synthase N-terminal-like domain-containing protein, partial [Terrimicrobiaceae bacterium]
MMSWDLPEDAVCVVSYGAVLPDAPTPAAFWKNLLAGHSAIRTIPDSRWKKSLYFAPDARTTDFTRATTAACVDDLTLAAAGMFSRIRLHQMTLQAASQIVSSLSLNTVNPRRIHVFLGCMDLDERTTKVRFPVEEFPFIRAHLHAYHPSDEAVLLDRLERYFTGDLVEGREFLDALFTSSVLHRLRERFGWTGEVGLIDAACASSLAAFETSIRLLQTREADLVISGGIESNLGPEAFAVFSVLGALAPDRCLPFDARGRGLSMGEGAALFALERLDDAIRLKHPVFGILRSCGVSSDGRSSSLFAPTIEGQMRAYAQAYAGLNVRDLAYLECHGTGTRIGDETELRSALKFFSRPDLPMGSVKALVGHTKGAAGAVSLLKCLLSLEHRIIPPSTYYREPAWADLRPNINTSPLPLPDGPRPLLMGLSGFGFGGINHHIVIQEYRPGARLHPPADPTKPREALTMPAFSTRTCLHPHLPPTEAREVRPIAFSSSPGMSRNAAEKNLFQPVVINAERAFSWKELDRPDILDQYNIPPNSRSQIDIMQLGAIVAVAELSREAGIDWSMIDPARVQVIAAGSLGLDACVGLALRLRYSELADAFGHLPADQLSALLQVKNHITPITPDSSAGILNNVTAGRVANVFDFRGANKSIDADLNSSALALRLTTLELERTSGVAIIIAVRETLDESGKRIIRTGLGCLILSSRDAAWEF